MRLRQQVSSYIIEARILNSAANLYLALHFGLRDLPPGSSATFSLEGSLPTNRPLRVFDYPRTLTIKRECESFTLTQQEFLHTGVARKTGVPITERTAILTFGPIKDGVSLELTHSTGWAASMSSELSEIQWENTLPVKITERSAILKKLREFHDLFEGQTRT